MRKKITYERVVRVKLIGPEKRTALLEMSLTPSSFSTKWSFDKMPIDWVREDRTVTNLAQSVLPVMSHLDREAYGIIKYCIAMSEVWQIFFRPALPLSQQVHGIYFLVCLRVFFRKQSNNTVPLLQWSLVGPWKPSQHNFGVLHCSMTLLTLDDTQFFDPKVIQNVT